ncbi:NtrZ family periplasmic regulatory protein [Caulobacter sp.]|uniref:NtrZ family periplasmic regulatory protein n=1 Tax=Caulobacter sp. TaxID=78 RepID=UPI002B4A1EC5|nr:hypothetical protein [Caulobacter sp.]HJV42074.1 hypothetical protein [Caulobacter sp.]
MVAKRFFLAGAAALILTGSAATAFAQAKPHAVAPDFSVKNDFTSAAAGVQYPMDDKRTLRWDAKKGRWGLKLDLDQPASRDMQMQDVQAGAYFKLTPSIRVGGAVSLGESNPALAARKAQQPEPAPRVRLETAFKF